MCNSSCADSVYNKLFRWLGHVARKRDDDLPMMMTFSTLEGASKSGGMLNLDLIMSERNLDSLGLAQTRWKRCQDRLGGKAVIGTLLQRTSSLMWLGQACNNNNSNNQHSTSNQKLSWLVYASLYDFCSPCFGQPDEATHYEGLPLAPQRDGNIWRSRARRPCPPAGPLLPHPSR